MEVLGFLLGTVFFIALEAFFAGSEIALVSVDRGRIANLYKKTKQEFLRDFLENPEDYITLTMLGYTVSIVFASTFYTLAVIKLSEYVPFIKGFEVLFSSSLVVLTLLLGELLPKNLFQEHAERLVFPSLLVLSRLKAVARPLLYATRVISRAVRNLFISHRGEVLEKEELLYLLEEVSKGEEGMRVAYRILSMRELFITEEIKPIQEVVMVEEGAGVQQVLSIMKESGYRRLPVYRRRVDHIIGYVDLFDLLENRHAKYIKELIRPVHYFSEFTTIDKVFELFKKSKEHMGIVVDERGNILGITTWDDLQSYVLGSYTEGKHTEEEIIEIEKDKWVMEGGTEREKVEKALQLELPEGPYTTLGGFICFYLKGFPSKGQVIHYGGYKFKVLQMDERRIIKVLVEKDVWREKKPEGTSAGAKA